MNIDYIHSSSNEIFQKGFGICRRDPAWIWRGSQDRFYKSAHIGDNTEILVPTDIVWGIFPWDPVMRRISCFRVGIRSISVSAFLVSRSKKRFVGTLESSIVVYTTLYR